MHACTRWNYPGGMEGWVDLVDLISPRPGVEPATFRSRVWRRTAAPPLYFWNLLRHCVKTQCAYVCSGKNLSSRFQTTSGVTQGCILPTAFFSVAMDWVLEHMSQKPGIDVGTTRFTDLVYAHDISFFVTSTQEAVRCLSSFSSSVSNFNIWSSCLLAEDQNLEYRFRHTAFRHHCWWQHSGARSITSYISAVTNPPIATVSQTWSGTSLSHQQPCRPYNESGVIGVCVCLPKSGFTNLLSCQSPHCETWNLLAADVKAGSFPDEMPMPDSCQDHVWNTDVSSLMGLVLDPIVRRRSSLFGHVTRILENTPVHQALQCQIDLSLGRLPYSSWRQCPGRPRNSWLDQLLRDSSTPPADFWRRASRHWWVHVLGVTLRSSSTTLRANDDDVELKLGVAFIIIIIIIMWFKNTLSHSQ